MKEFQPSHSFFFEETSNEFMAEYLQFQTCPFCMRQFFRGKLSLHLKHCNHNHPMSKSNKPNHTHHTPNKHHTIQTMYERCPTCNARMPKFMMEKHSKHCSLENTSIKRAFKKDINQQNTQDKSQEVSLPRIRNSARDDIQRNKSFKKEIKKPLSSVKVREDLRCFRRAEEVQKVKCDSCGRKFSEAAALRHIPVCSQIKDKEMKSILHKHSKSMFSQTKRPQNKDGSLHLENHPKNALSQDISSEKILEAELQQSMENIEDKKAVENIEDTTIRPQNQ